MVKGWYRAGRRFESWALYIYPYRREIQFWFKFLRALENFKSRRNLEKSEFGPRFESHRRMAHRPIGPSASAHERIGALAHRRIGTGTLKANGNGNPEWEGELGTGTGTLNGNGKRNTEKIPKRGEICIEIQFSAIFFKKYAQKLPLAGFEPTTL